ncbi:protein RALF-like 19 [Macadamia integrifolia]|uniref:protein RALF-like 19 n=1 Tax=Macadamia integrifolia TaxID=60698 RepID=UPI001C4F81FD|nr:protein RALF-like 19 [Macadamia integrifolia]
MATTRLSVVFLLLALVAMALMVDSSPLFSIDDGLLAAVSKSACNGLVGGECISEANEEMMMMIMDSDDDDDDVVRRGLYRRRRYISYEALKANKIPCRRPGQSYYDCRKNLKINPYRRSCTMATHCARDLR